MSTEIPGQIGPYRLREQIGRESGAALFRAVDPAGRPVILRLLPARLAEDARAFERFRTEAAALIREPHPNLLRILATGQENGRPYLVQEAFEGKPLAEVLRARRLTTAEAFRVMKEVCQGLAHAHEHGVLHGHLWPSAVRVSDDLAEVKVTDFAFSRLDALGMTGTVSTGALSLGAFHYLAPELMSNRSHLAPDHRADLYAAGILFQEMLTGRPPGDRVGLPSQINSSLLPETDVVVLKCLARNPQERYASAVDVLAALDRLEEAMRVRLLSEIRDITRSGARGKAMLWGAAALLVAALVIAAVVLLR